MAFLILAWLFIRQAGAVVPEITSTATTAAAQERDDQPSGTDAEAAEVRMQKPRLLLAVMTPVNLFTGVLSCGLICVITAWMDRRWLPAELRPPVYLTGFNLLGGVVFLALGIKGYWDNENRVIAVGSLFGLFAVAILIAQIAGPMLEPPQSPPKFNSGESVT